MMGLLAVIRIVLCEVKRLKFIMTVCGPDCQKGTSCVQLALGPNPLVLLTVSLGPEAGNLSPSRRNIKNIWSLTSQHFVPLLPYFGTCGYCSFF